jgi:hypothetical protein
MIVLLPSFDTFFINAITHHKKYILMHIFLFFGLNHILHKLASDQILIVYGAMFSNLQLENPLLVLGDLMVAPSLYLKSLLNRLIIMASKACTCFFVIVFPIISSYFSLNGSKQVSPISSTTQLTLISTSPPYVQSSTQHGTFKF